MNVTMIEPEVAAPSTELTVQARAALALGSSQTRIDLAAMALKSVNIVEIKDKAGRDECHSYAMALVKARTAISNTGKAAREDATKFSKAVIAEEASLIEITAAEEKRLLALRDAWDEVVAAEKAAKEAAERARILAITRRIDDLRLFATNAAKCRTSAAIQTLIDNLAAIEMTGFAEFEDEALFVRKATMEAMETVLLAKQAEEAERAQQAAAAAQLAAEQAAAAAQLKKEREELEAARKAQEAETARNRAAAIAEADRLASERQRLADEAAAQRNTEQAAIDAQRAKELEELNKQRAELAAQQAAFEAQQAALARVVIAPVAIETVAPVVESEQAAEVLVLTGEMVVVPKQSTRPTDRAMLAAIAEQWCVTNRQAFDWLYTFDFGATNDELLEEERAL